MLQKFTLILSLLMLFTITASADDTPDIEIDVTVAEETPKTEIFGFSLGDSKLDITAQCAKLGYKLEETKNERYGWRCSIQGDREHGKVRFQTRTKPAYIGIGLTNDVVTSLLFTFYEPMPWLEQIRYTESRSITIGEAHVESIDSVNLHGKGVKSPIFFSEEEEWISIHVSFFHDTLQEKVYVLDISSMKIPDEVKEALDL